MYASLSTDMTRSSADKLQLFIASIGNLAGDEARKAKLLYVRNELADFEAECSDARSFGLLQIVFAVIPLFWPFLLVQRHSMVNAAKLSVRRIRNALDVWKEDLGDEQPRLAAELDRLATGSPRLLPWGKR